MPFYFCLMAQYIEWVWFFCLLIMTGHHLLVFRLRPLSKGIPIKEWPGVSVIIAHKNHADTLSASLHRLAQQDYPTYEILIIDDHSTVAEKEKLQYAIAEYPIIQLVSNDSAGKKGAVAVGIHQAQYNLILCTDADCKPVSDQWIKTMVSSGRRNEVVLGYSPYKRELTWLNKLIRFETLYTGMQYLSWAKIGQPYMGVGRNLLYPRMLFLNVNPYEGNTVAYGDDDLLVQKMSVYARVKMCENPASFMVSVAPSSLQQWLRQKHRHLSAGHYYKSSAWLTPAIFAIALFVHWLLVIPLIILSLWWKWLPVLIIGLLIRLINYAFWTKRFGERDTILWYPLLEMIYSAYLGIAGMYTSLFKKKTWN